QWAQWPRPTPQIPP
uniref:Bradykinin-potentiating peptide 14a n=2 Tax=Bothrops TaxID=8721 RepID=BPPEA_BOTJA|nr:RecName: Full=Bradykinin-potentiating peptide 14a; Short=BPP-14a; Contains: RecName: Full=Bradykinin-potentiating peptide 11a; Short=BPP-11a; AltName: Full=Bradykinin-potentiating peptide V-2; Short=BPPV-2; Contains: RecName: Full=Bradykinin-potentiating peptide 11a-F; Short=BPP-11a-F; Contains: RecName: Full=Bradykinin-potentiating peptide 5b; Short=BPP-5b [Bothrops jararaca]